MISGICEKLDNSCCLLMNRTQTDEVQFHRESRAGSVLHDSAKARTWVLNKQIFKVKENRKTQSITVTQICV